MQTVSIYVLPTEQDLPPRAIIGEFEEGDDKIAGRLATWSADTGTWLLEGMPVPEELAEAITAHARDLGVTAWD